MEKKTSRIITGWRQVVPPRQKRPKSPLRPTTPVKPPATEPATED